MNSDNYKLSRNDFQNSSSNAFKLLKQDTDFLDVTLACEDGKILKAHKVVLSSFSSVFQNILKNNPHAHPLIYLTGVQQMDIQHILDFIYLGEATVDKVDIERFMDLAEKFRINGLVDYKEHNDVKSFLKINPTKDKRLAGEVTSAFCKQEQIDNQMTDEMLGDEEEIENEMNVVAEVAEDQFSGLDEAQEIFGVEEIDDQTKTKQETKRKARNSLDGNKRKFNCNECDYIATQSGSLKIHVMAKHQGIRFPCQVCDYKGTTKGNTNMHMKNKHSL